MEPQHDVSSYSHIDEYLESQRVVLTGWSQRLIAKAALDRGLAVGQGRSPKVTVLRDGKRCHTWEGGATTFNTRLAKRTVRRKETTSKLLRSFGIPFPENASFLPDEITAAWSWAEAILPVVVKPNAGRQGRSVFVNISTLEEFSRAFNAVASNNGERVLVEQMLPGVEHRCLVLNNKVIAVTRRRAASVVGDGERSIRDLVDHKNQFREPIHLPLELGDVEVAYLREHGFTLESVPAAGDVVALRGTSNLHTGGDAIDATGTLSEGEIQTIEAAARRIPGLRLAGFDVLLPRGTERGEIGFIEINDSPMISMHHFPWEGESRDVAGAIVEAMFPDARLA